MNETPTANPDAFRELRDAIVSLGGDASDIVVPDSDVPDSQFVDALNAHGEEVARAIGVARATALIQPDDYGGDPFRFLKEGASLVFAARSNYGASSVEVAPKKALLRLVAPEHSARKVGDAPNRVPVLASAFLERAIEVIAGEPHVPRYLGHAPRVDMRFDRPMVNLLFDFDLDEG
jgi:hypothetical protein